MAFENSQVLTAESKRLAGGKQLECFCRIDAPEGKQIKRVVSVSALAKIISSEKVSENIDFLGKTSFQVVYETEEGELASLSVSVEWNDKANMNVDNYFLKAEAQECVVTGFSGNEVALSAVVNVDIYYIAQEKIVGVTNLSEDYVVQEKTFEYEKLVNMATETFNDVAEQEYNGKIEEVLFYSAGGVKLKSAVAGIDSVIIEGETEIDISAIDNGRIVSISKVVDFKQEVSSLSVVPNNLVDASVWLNDLKVTASVNETDNKTNLIIAIEYGLSAVVFAKETATIVEDAFSTRQEINTTYECVNVTNFESKNEEKENVVGCFNVEKSLYELCFVSSTTACIKEMNNSVQGCDIAGELGIEFVCETEGREKIKIQGVIPFNISFDGVDKNDNVNISSRIISYRLKNQNEVEVVAEVYIEYDKYEKGFVNYLAFIEETGEVKPALPAIKVYVVRENQDLFAVSKELGVRPELIQLQNPTIEECNLNGSRIIIYSPLDARF